jgi:hypothetical protein
MLNMEQAGVVELGGPPPVGGPRLLVLREHGMSREGAAGVLLSWDAAARSSWQFIGDATSGIEVREVGNKGLGGFALHDVAAGERLLCEPALLQWDGTSTARLDADVAQLDSATSQAFWGLCQNEEHGATKRCVRRVLTACSVGVASG